MKIEFARVARAYGSLLIASLLVPAANAVAADGGEERLHFGIDVGVRWEDNINLGGDEVDTAYVGDEEFDDLTTGVSGTVSYDLLQRQGAKLNGGLTAFYNDVNDIDGLSNYGFTLALKFDGEFGPEFTDPWYSLTLEYTDAEFDDSKIRDGDWIDAEAMLGKRFNPQFGLSGGFRYHDRSQDNSRGLCPRRANPDCPGDWGEDEVFEQERWGVFVHADWFLTTDTSLYFEYSYSEGDEDATVALRGGRDPGWLNIQDTFADDPVYGLATFRNPVNGFTSQTNYIVWKVEAEQNVYEIGLRHRFSDRISAELITAFLETSDVESPDRTSRSKSVDNYRNTVVMATISFSLR